MRAMMVRLINLLCKMPPAKSQKPNPPECWNPMSLQAIYWAALSHFTFPVFILPVNVSPFFCFHFHFCRQLTGLPEKKRGRVWWLSSWSRCLFDVHCLLFSLNLRRENISFHWVSKWRHTKLSPRVIYISPIEVNAEVPQLQFGVLDSIKIARAWHPQS